jgi:hypothetical protein
LFGLQASNESTNGANEYQSISRANQAAIEGHHFEAIPAEDDRLSVIFPGERTHWSLEEAREAQ